MAVSAAASDRVVLIPEPGEIPGEYIAEFHCRSLVRLDSGEVAVAELFRIGIAFHDDYEIAAQHPEVADLA